jgi:hypothetical protein
MAGAHLPLLGINNRDLRTFVTDVGVTRRLAPRVPLDRLVISESGLTTPEDLAALAADGVRAFLIGESLMRQPDVEAATRALLADPLRRASDGAVPFRRARARPTWSTSPTRRRRRGSRWPKAG